MAINQSPQPTGLNIIKASAGSGKTYTLARSYIEHLLFKPDRHGRLQLRNVRNYHRHILAITFTNKATEEMKHRIVKELHILSQDPMHSDYRAHFEAHCTPEAFDGLQGAATRALQEIMFDYGSFNVSTIDSFFQTILRSFARELDHDYNYDVQIDGGYAVRVAVHNFLLSLGSTGHRSGGNSEIERWVKTLMQEQLSAGGSWKFFADTTTGDHRNALVELASHFNSEVFRTAMPAMRRYLYREDGTRRMMDFEKIGAFKRALIDARKRYRTIYCEQLEAQLHELLSRHGLSTAILSGGKSIAKLLKEDKLAREQRPTDAFAGITADNVADQLLKKYQATTPVAALDELAQWVASVNATWAALRFVDAMVSQLGLLGLIGAIDEQIELFRHSTNSILLADTNDLIARVLSGGVPFVYERVGTWIHHYLIDEFQDTSTRQYDNFRPLLEESLDQNAGDNFNLVIGDSKQSIYRFRNADPSLFRDRVEAEMQHSGREMHRSSLDTNYRSLPAIVKFNNELFRHIVALYDPAGVVTRTYAGLEQEESAGARKRGDGYVAVRFASPVSGEPYDKFDKVLAELPAMLLELHERFEWSQIGILVNEKSDGKAIVECVLKHNSDVRAEQGAESRIIPVMSDESLLLVNSPSVRRLVSLLRFIDMVQDAPTDGDDRMAERLENQRRQYTALDRFNHLLQSHPDADAGTLLATVFADDAPAEQSPTEQLIDLIMPDRRTESSSLVNLVERLIEHNLIAGDEELAASDNAFLLAFQDAVIDFTQQRNGGSIREFLRYWDTCGEKLTVSSSATSDAVTVMTIHTSKGLEFDCVLIPCADWLVGAPRSRDDIYWMTRSQWLEQGGDRLVPVADAALVPPLLPVSRSLLKGVAQHGGMMTNFYTANAMDTLIDNLNKTYVAFTRPRCELHIVAVGKIDSAHVDDTVCSLLAHALRHDSEDVVERGCKRKGRYPQSSQPRSADVMPPYRVHHVQVEVKLPKETTDSQDDGIRMHNVLSRIVDATDMERALRVCHDRGIITDDETQRYNLHTIHEVLARAFADEQKSAWFDPANTAVYTERTITRGAGQDNYRPDRIVVRPDGMVIVVDYKTGEPRRKDVAQVRNYMRLLREAGHGQVQGYLWYLATDTVQAVAFN